MVAVLWLGFDWMQAAQKLSTMKAAAQAEISSRDLKIAALQERERAASENFTIILDERNHTIAELAARLERLRLDDLPVSNVTEERLDQLRATVASLRRELAALVDIAGVNRALRASLIQAQEELAAAQKANQESLAAAQRRFKESDVGRNQARAALTAARQQARDALARIRDRIKQLSGREATVAVERTFNPKEEDPITDGVPDLPGTILVPAILHLPPKTDPLTAAHWLRLNVGFTAATRAPGDVPGRVLRAGGVWVPPGFDPCSLRLFPFTMCEAPCCQVTIGGLVEPLVVCRVNASCDLAQCNGTPVSPTPSPSALDADSLEDEQRRVFGPLYAAQTLHLAESATALQLSKPRSKIGARTFMSDVPVARRWLGEELSYRTAEGLLEHHIPVCACDQAVSPFWLHICALPLAAAFEAAQPLHFPNHSCFSHIMGWGAMDRGLDRRTEIYTLPAFRVTDRTPITDPSALTAGLNYTLPATAHPASASQPVSHSDMFPARYLPFNMHYLPVPRNLVPFLKRVGGPGALATCLSRTWSHVLEKAAPAPAGSVG
ncbi:hypothetical protein PAPYR_6590 [Paratrimastix pyriformis]|uniref:Uncharacterized protein n=1 Tax=Paratrimastix pyriformis TaxID=342808 RepID=A0ABQ8UEW2_9EUKA|nr:hypothetical protein PAPYR_6590 [Paratrimastix pyriformis]